MKHINYSAIMVIILTMTTINAYEITEPTDISFGQERALPSLAEQNIHLTNALTKKIATKMYRKNLSAQEKKLLGLQQTTASSFISPQQYLQLKHLQEQDALIAKNIESHKRFINEIKTQTRPSSGLDADGYTLAPQTQHKLDAYGHSIEQAEQIVAQEQKQPKKNAAQAKKSKIVIQQAHSNVLNAQNAFLESLEK